MRLRLRYAALCGALALAASLVGCSATEGDGAAEAAPAPEASEFPSGLSGKADVFGRALIGIAQPYNADLGLSLQEERLRTDMAFRRQVAWDIVQRVIDPVPLLGVAELGASNEELEVAEGDIPTVARWQTWYGVEDFKRMFRELYGNLTPEERAARTPFTPESIAEIERWNAAAQERSERWPLDRFLKHVSELGVCPEGMEAEDCAQSLQSNFSGATSGNARITYSPSTIRHLLENYGPILTCLEALDQLDPNATPENEDQNFTYCMESEFPADAVLTKAHWIRSDFNRTMPAFDTDAAGLSRVIGETKTADWAAGDRQVDPLADKIVTIRLRNGDMYRLAGLHIMTKELRHWVWTTMWWSDQPDSDFGEDRPASVQALGPVWANYKMGVVVDYKEGDADPSARFPDQPSLAAALGATQGETTWLSNPYVEHGRGNARTNCIGCHQHGGSTLGPDLDGDGTPDALDIELIITNDVLYPQNGRTQQRTLFPTDYLWSTLRVDSLAQVIKTESGNFDFADAQLAADRVSQILALPRDHFQGAVEFDANCRACHGADGKGTSAAPDLYERVPTLSDEELITTLIYGRDGGMPAWGHFSDRQLADIYAHLRQTFVPVEEVDEEDEVDEDNEERPRDDSERFDDFE
ncbi:MAG: cytochrome c [Myxococcota bacterium]